jgi:hypothetical protein
MGDEGDAARQLDRAQKAIEYVLALIVPILLAVMLYSYVLYDELFTPLFAVTMGLTLLTVYPAYRALRLHYHCWAKNTMPQRLVTGLIGTIYISAASVFGVAVLSSSKGLDPEQPLTFAVLALLAVLLIVVMAYNSRYKERNERTDIRFYHQGPEGLTSDIKTVCASRQEEYDIVQVGNRTSITLPKSKVSIIITKQAGDSSEVMMECGDPVSSDLCSALKQGLDQES